jgi:ribonuclease-3
MYPFTIFKKRYPSSIEKKIGYRFTNQTLLKKALTHRSAAACQGDSYERLEFLGDAVLDLVVSEYLFQKYRDDPEGKLTQNRSILVNAHSLFEVAKSLNLQNNLLVDKSIDLEYSPTQQNLLSSALEAVIGAIYLDRGIQPARKFIHKFIITGKRHDATITNYNYKGQLLEFCQKNSIDLPEFKTENIRGPDHARKYTIAVYVNNELLGKGRGTTKRTAEQQAAEAAYKKLNTTRKL